MRAGRAAWYAVLSLVLWAVLLRSRGLGSRAIAESLWTEDSTIFLNQAYALGEATLWTSYHGFLYTFQRLVCLPVAGLPLAAVPYLLFAGWCLAFLVLGYVLDDRLGRRGLGVVWVSLAVAFIALQPHDGEVFFSITNSQWVLGLALALYIGLPEPDPGWVEVGALAVACVTGPFAVMLLPILLLQAALRRDFHSRWKTYLVVGVGAVIQLSVLLASNRLKTNVQTGDTTSSWVTAAWTFASFGALQPLAVALAVALWAMILAGLLLVLKARAPERTLDLACLFGAAAIIFGVGLYSVSLWSSVTNIGPLGVGGGRYYFVPYGLVFCGAVLAMHGARGKFLHALPWAFVAAAGALCVLSFRPQPRDDLQWPAFARFATVHAGVEIPINPQWPVPPTWNVIPSQHATEGPAALSKVPLESLRKEAVGVSFDLRQHCPASSLVGLEAQVSREKAGYASVAWGSGGGAQQHAGQLKRFYPDGSVTLQFAFSRRQGEDIVVLVPSTDSPFALHSVEVYCLDSAS
jgi:hypothetical protein